MMYARLIIAVTSLAIVSAATGIGFSDGAKARQITNERTAVYAFTGHCETQHWPAFSAQCLQTVDGRPWDREFRVVAQF